MGPCWQRSVCATCFRIRPHSSDAQNGKSMASAQPLLRHLLNSCLDRCGSCTNMRLNSPIGAVTECIGRIIRHAILIHQREKYTGYLFVYRIGSHSHSLSLSSNSLSSHSHHGNNQIHDANIGIRVPKDSLSRRVGVLADTGGGGRRGGRAGGACVGLRKMLWGSLCRIPLAEQLKGCVYFTPF